VWTLGAWCESRNDFRNFRLDRINRVSLSDRRFVEERGKGLNDFLKKMRAEGAGG
jgi:predicted DNA-binding transcriptional regulator YafY